MESPDTENISLNQKAAAVKELIRGREYAAQLQSILHMSSEDHGSVETEELVAKILKSFTEAFTALNSGESGENHEDPAPCSDDQRDEDSSENREIPASVDHPTVACKRRRMVEAWTKIAPKPTEDGHAWRKYGQKRILNAKYPRSYFRCTHKYDQGCQASKQIQQIEDQDPPMYRITYIGHHTCKDVLVKAPLFVIDGIPGEGFLSNIESNTSTTKPEQLPSCFSSNSSVKQEHKNELALNETHNNNQSSLEYFLWSDLPSIVESSSRPTSSSLLLPSTPGSEDYGDVSGGYSCTTTSSSHSSFDMNSVNFDEFRFEYLLC